MPDRNQPVAQRNQAAETKKPAAAVLQHDGRYLAVEDPSANPERRDTSEFVHRALQLLEPEFRSVIVLRLIDGYSVKETAAILKLPPGTVASRLSRGQKKLKDILSNWNIFS